MEILKRAKYRGAAWKTVFGLTKRVSLPEMRDAVHFDLDGAWDRTVLALPRLDLRPWGPRLRYCARRNEIEEFYRQVQPHLVPFVLYGSGDFHYLAAILVHRISKPFTLVSFDGHPDWDIRPPFWSCGGWVNRALESAKVDRVVVWGCGNFELAFPAYLFANHRALRTGRLEVHAWAERQSLRIQRRFHCMTRQNWYKRFERFASELSGKDVYVTIDLDCLRAEEAVSNWENGLFTAADLGWALAQLRRGGTIIGGDVCGAYSRPVYDRLTQRFAGSWDHPKGPKSGPLYETRSRAINRAAIEVIWPALTSGLVRASPPGRNGVPSVSLVDQALLGTASLACGTSVKTDLGRAYVVDLEDLKGSCLWKSVLTQHRKDHRSLEIIEETIRQDFEYHYIVLEDHAGRVRDIQPSFVHTQDLMGGMGPRVQKLMRCMRWVMPRLLTMRTLMVGSPICEGHLAATPEDREWCGRALHAALGVLASKYRASLVVLKEYPWYLRESLACFTNDGYTRIASMPYATLELNFADFEEYMRNVLSRSFRKNLRRKFRDAAKAEPVTMQVVTDIAPYVEEVYPLYLQVYERSKLRFEKLTREYLCRMSEDRPEKTRFFIWRQGSKAVAFSACMVHGGALWDEYLGLDYSVALDLHLYFLTFRDLINWSCQQGLSRYYTTALSYDPKLHLKCKLVPLDLYVRHTNPLLNRLFRPFLKLLQPTRGDPAIGKFPNAKEI